MCKLDKTIINLATILISGTGLFVVLTKFNVPELNMSFFGGNPYAVKRDIIEGVMSFVFTYLTLFGLAIQAFKEIFFRQIPERLYTYKFYSIVFMAGLFFMALTFFALDKIGNKIAKQNWLPCIVESQKHIFESAVFIIGHNGWRKDQINKKEKIDNPDRMKALNYQVAQRYIKQIENLLELNTSSEALKLRLEKLKPYFR